MLNGPLDSFAVITFTAAVFPARVLHPTTGHYERSDVGRIYRGRVFSNLLMAPEGLMSSVILLSRFKQKQSE